MSWCLLDSLANPGPPTRTILKTFGGWGPKLIDVEELRETFEVHPHLEAKLTIMSKARLGSNYPQEGDILYP